MNKPKIIALYLPQFHCIPENDQFWGKGFTDWVSVKKAKPLFKGHNQPIIPNENNYYDLSKQESVEWQAKLAKDNGIYGFGVYHYWFNNEKNLLTKPAETLRDSPKVGIKYFFIWDNNNWKRSWSNVEGNSWALTEEKLVDKDTGLSILIPFILGTEPDWENHYNYLRSHFMSPNYEKYNNKPVFCIFWHNKEIEKMCEYWDLLAKKDGFDGIHIIYKDSYSKLLSKSNQRYTYQPHWSGWHTPSFIQKVINKLCKIIKYKPRPKTKMKVLDYDKVWKQIINYSAQHKEKELYHGAFVGYDDSPRRGKSNAIIIKNGNPEKFKKYFDKLYKISASQNKDYIFLTAWNEWGEGAYLEPDTNNGYKYLYAIKEIVNDYQ